MQQILPHVCMILDVSVWVCLSWYENVEIIKRYGVFLKKVLHKREEKMQEKMKMTSQKDENLVQVQ